MEYRLGRLRYSSSIHLAIYILPALIASIVLNIPKFFETELIWYDTVEKETNITVRLVDYQITSLRLDPDYSFYYTHWTRLLATGLLPILFLLLLNMMIVLRLRQPRGPEPRLLPGPGSHSFIRRTQSVPAGIPRVVEGRGVSMRVHSTAAAPSSHSAGLLIAIGLVYLVCNVPRLLLNLTEAVAPSSQECGAPPHLRWGPGCSLL
jgi:hypothetical protein